MPEENTHTITVPVPASVADTLKGASTLATQAPHWFALILVVGGFLFYLDRHEDKFAARMDNASQVDVLRIDACHDVQDRSIAAIEDLNTTMGAQSQTFQEMDDTFKKLLQELEAHAKLK